MAASACILLQPTITKNILKNEYIFKIIKCAVMCKNFKYILKGSSKDE
jgi:hypothetical protein